jgi:nucleotide-binding universal stress UspA family protein
MTCHGNVVDVILGMGADFDVDLIVMTTEGHNSLLDMVRGSTMELVLRGARCPLLALPV